MPATQALQPDAPPVEYLPAAHAAQALEPATTAKLPAAQGEQAVELGMEMAPARHDAQRDEVVAPVDPPYLPAGQLEQVCEPDVAE